MNRLDRHETGWKWLGVFLLMLVFLFGFALLVYFVCTEQYLLLSGPCALLAISVWLGTTPKLYFHEFVWEEDDQ